MRTVARGNRFAGQLAVYRNAFSTATTAGQSLSGSFTIEAVSPTTDGTYTWTYNTPAGVGTNNHVSGFGGITTHVLKTTQMLNFVPGKFNEFLFKIKMTNPEHLTLGTNQGFQFVIWDIKTSVPDGYSFELKLQSNWESYFNINVVNKNNRNKIIRTQHIFCRCS